MNRTILALCATLLAAVTPAQAIDAPEIIATYYQNIGGREAWSRVNGFLVTGEIEQGSSKLPISHMRLKDGRGYMKMVFQGKEMMSEVFDGEVLWNTSFMTMKPELADAETTANYKLGINDFPSDLFRYKENGYSVEYLGEESFDGTPAYKVKLVNEPRMVGGVVVPDISYYYFDTESIVLLGAESEIPDGPMKGRVAQTKFSDYQEVEGLYFPFSISNGIKGGGSSSVVLKRVELNPTVDDAVFKMPLVDEPKAEAAKGE